MAYIIERNTVLNIARNYGSDPCISKAINLLNNYRASHTLRNIVRSIVFTSFLIITKKRNEFFHKCDMINAKKKYSFNHGISIVIPSLLFL